MMLLVTPRIQTRRDAVEEYIKIIFIGKLTNKTCEVLINVEDADELAYALMSLTSGQGFARIDIMDGERVRKDF